MKVTGYVQKGSGATVTFDDNSVVELIIDDQLDILEDLSTDQEAALKAFYVDRANVNSPIVNLDPRFSDPSLLGAGSTGTTTTPPPPITGPPSTGTPGTILGYDAAGDLGERGFLGGSATTASDDAVGAGGVSSLAAPEDHKHAAQAPSADVNNATVVGADGLHHTPIAQPTDIASATAGQVIDASSVIDEDTMISDSDQKIPTQQSVKAYIDGLVAAIPSAIQVPLTLDVANAAAGALPTGEATGKSWIVVNAPATGTVLGGSNPITVHNGDKIVVSNGVTSSNDDGADFVKYDNTDSVQSVNGQVGAVTVGENQLHFVDDTAARNALSANAGDAVFVRQLGQFQTTLDGTTWVTGANQNGLLSTIPELHLGSPTVTPDSAYARFSILAGSETSVVIQAASNVTGSTIVFEIENDNSVDVGFVFDSTYKNSSGDDLGTLTFAAGEKRILVFVSDGGNLFQIGGSSGKSLDIVDLDATSTVANYDLGSSVGASSVILNIVDITNGGMITSSDPIVGEVDISNYSETSELIAIPEKVKSTGVPLVALQADNAPDTFTWLIEPGVVELQRGNSGGLYNTITEAGWVDPTSPDGTEWRHNGGAWTTFKAAYGNQIGNNITTPAYADVEMRVISTGTIYKMTFTGWQNGNGGGFAGEAAPIVVVDGWSIKEINPTLAGTGLFDGDQTLGQNVSHDLNDNEFEITNSRDGFIYGGQAATVDAKVLVGSQQVDLSVRAIRDSDSTTIQRGGLGVSDFGVSVIAQGDANFSINGFQGYAEQIFGGLDNVAANSLLGNPSYVNKGVIKILSELDFTAAEPNYPLNQPIHIGKLHWNNTAGAGSNSGGAFQVGLYRHGVDADGFGTPGWVFEESDGYIITFGGTAYFNNAGTLVPLGNSTTIVDNLTSASTTDALSAAQGMVLLGMIDALGTVEHQANDQTDQFALTNLTMGDKVFVVDATADSAVDTGWAIYRYLGTGTSGAYVAADFLKIAEQESLDVTVTSSWSMQDEAGASFNIDDGENFKLWRSNAASGAVTANIVNASYVAGSRIIVNRLAGVTGNLTLDIDVAAGQFVDGNGLVGNLVISPGDSYTLVKMAGDHWMITARYPETPTSELYRELSTWTKNGTATILHPPQVIDNVEVVGIEDTEAGAQRYFLKTTDTPSDGNRYLHFRVRLDATNTHSMMIRAGRSSNVAEFNVSLDNGAHLLTRVGNVRLPEVVRQHVTENFAEFLVRMPEIANSDTWQLYPSVGPNGMTSRSDYAASTVGATYFEFLDTNAAPPTETWNPVYQWFTDYFLPSNTTDIWNYNGVEGSGVELRDISGSNSIISGGSTIAMPDDTFALTYEIRKETNNKTILIDLRDAGNVLTRLTFNTTTGVWSFTGGAGTATIRDLGDRWLVQAVFDILVPGDHTMNILPDFGGGQDHAVIYRFDLFSNSEQQRDPSDLAVMFEGMRWDNGPERPVPSMYDDRPSLILEDLSTTTSHFEYTGHLPLVDDGIVRIQLVLDSAATHAVLLRTVDSPQVQNLSIMMDTGATVSGAVAGGIPPTILSSEIRNGVLTLVVRFAASSGTASWDFFPAAGPVATPGVFDGTTTGKTELLELDFNYTASDYSLETPGGLDTLVAKIHSVHIPSKGGLSDLSNQGRGLNSFIGDVAFDADGHAVYGGGFRSVINTDGSGDSLTVYALVKYDDATDGDDNLSVFNGNTTTFIPLGGVSTSTETIRVNGAANSHKFYINGETDFATRADVRNAMNTGDFVLLKVEGIANGTALAIGDHPGNPGFDFDGALKSMVIVEGPVNEADDLVIDYAMRNGIDPLDLSRITSLTEVIANAVSGPMDNGTGGSNPATYDYPKPFVFTEPTVLRFEHTGTVVSGSSWFAFGTTAGTETDGVGNLGDSGVARLTSTSALKTFEVMVQPGTYFLRLGAGGGSDVTTSAIKITKVLTGNIDVADIVGIDTDYETVITPIAGSVEVDVTSLKSYGRIAVVEPTTMVLSPTPIVGSVTQLKIDGQGHALTLPSSVTVLRGAFDSVRRNHVTLESVSPTEQLAKIYSIGVETLLFRSTPAVGGLFTTAAEVNNVNPTVDRENSDKFSRLDMLEDFRRPTGEFRFRLYYPTLDEEIIWEQTNNFVTDALAATNSLTVDNYNLISSSNAAVLGTGTTEFTGISWDAAWDGSTGALYSGNTNVNFWYPLGQSSLHAGGIPAYQPVATDTIEFYAIID